MASSFKIYWRRGRQLQKPLDTVETAPPSPPAGEPVSAWTPYFRRTRNQTHRRLPEENPHNPEYAETPAVPFFIASVVPATSIKRRETRRHLRPVPQHDEWAQTTTRITHLTASVLYGQGPPTTRVTHLTAAVIYRAPTSQGVPETERKEPEKKGKKRKSSFPGGEGGGRQRRNIPPLFVYPLTPPGFFAGQYPSFVPQGFFKSEFTRKLQTPLELNEYAEPAPVVVSVAAETPVLKANRTRFERKLQPVAHNPAYPPTPAGFFDGFFPGSKRVESFNISFERQFQSLPQHDEFPETPPGFFEGQWPASLTLRPFKVEFDRDLQALPPLWEYPPTPEGFFAGQWPASLTLRPIPVTYDRQRRDLPPLWEFPPTPAGFFEGFWPGSKRAEAFFVEFRRNLQALPKLDRFAPPPVSADDYAAFTPVPKFSWSYERALQPTLIPPEYPPTPFGFQWGFYPGSARVESFAWQFERDIQALALDEYPETPAGFFDGFWPGSKRAEVFFASFERNLQKLPPLDRFAEPAPAVDFAAYAPQPTLSWSFKRELQTLAIPPEYPPTPVISTPFVTPLPQRNRRQTGRFV